MAKTPSKIGTNTTATKAKKSSTAKVEPLKKETKKRTSVKVAEKTEPKKKAVTSKVAKKPDALAKLVQTIVNALQEKKGKEIVTMDLRSINNAVTDFFIICHGDSNVQINALARSVEEEVYTKLGEDPLHKEGFQNAEWILLDYVNVVVHIFNNEKRAFYGIERLWADAETKEIK